VTKGDLLTLLKGRGRGVPLFLAWIVGVIAHHVAYAVIFRIVYKPGVRYDLTTLLRIEFLLFLGLSFWQSILLLPLWWRRALWVSVLFILPICDFTVNFEAKHFPMFQAPPLAIPVFLHTLVMMGVRRRVWVWAATAVFFFFGSSIWMGSVFFVCRTLVNELKGFISTQYILSPSAVISLIMAIAFGAVAAFLMPPVDSNSAGRRLHFPADE
jgi:hypothetical protein